VTRHCLDWNTSQRRTTRTGATAHPLWQGVECSARDKVRDTAVDCPALPGLLNVSGSTMAILHPGDTVGSRILHILLAAVELAEAASTAADNPDLIAIKGE